MTNRVPFRTPTELALENPVTLKQIEDWLDAGHLNFQEVREEGSWAPSRVIPVTELPVLYALIEGKTPEEAEAERDEILSHIGGRLHHTPVGTPVTEEELEMRRLREANGA